MAPNGSSVSGLQILRTGLAFGESPRWHENRLWFSNWGTQEVIAVDMDGKCELIVHVPTTLPYCIDAESAVWYADVPNKRCVRVREGGDVLQSVEVDRGCFACMLGGRDRKTLFILAAEWHGVDKMIDAPRTGQILTIDAPAPGAGWP